MYNPSPCHTSPRMLPHVSTHFPLTLLPTRVTLSLRASAPVPTGRDVGGAQTGAHTSRPHISCASFHTFPHAYLPLSGATWEALGPVLASRNDARYHGAGLTDAVRAELLASHAAKLRYVSSCILFFLDICRGQGTPWFIHTRMSW